MFNPTHRFSLETQRGPSGEVTTQWDRSFPRSIYHVSIWGETVYVGTGSDIVAIETSGTERWRFSTNTPHGGMQSSPAVVDGTVYVGSDNNYVYALDAETGDCDWRFQTNRWVRSSPAVVDGTVYLGSADNYVYALDAETGNCDWRFQTEGRVNTSPMIASDEVYVGTSMYKNPDNNLSEPESFLYSIDAATGNGTWRFKMKGSVVSPVMADGVIFVSSDNYTTDEYKLYALEGKEVSMNNIETHGKEDCLACGSDLTIYDNVNFCPECGSEVSNNDNSDTRIYDPN